MWLWVVRWVWWWSESVSNNQSWGRGGRGFLRSLLRQFGGVRQRSGLFDGCLTPAHLSSSGERSVGHWSIDLASDLLSSEYLVRVVIDWNLLSSRLGWAELRLIVGWSWRQSRRHFALVFSVLCRFCDHFQNILITNTWWRRQISLQFLQFQFLAGTDWCGCGDWSRWFTVAALWWSAPLPRLLVRIVVLQTNLNFPFFMIE